MKPIAKIILLVMIAPMLSVSIIAHDPSEHKKGSEGANCAALENMDLSKMDAKDPIVRAMMQQCDGHHDRNARHKNHHDKSDKKPSENKENKR